MGELYWQAAGYTDIGGGTENQDSFFMWEDVGLGVCVACVCDGHGKEVGRTASSAACDAISSLCKESAAALVADPVGWLTNCMQHAQKAVKEAFRAILRQSGCIVEETTEGYLVKKKDLSANWACVHGGTSCTVVVIIGQMLYCANVGDSSAILCSKQPVLSQSMVEHVVDTALPPNSPLKSAKLRRNAENAEKPSESTNVILLCAEHSPECVDEFYRMREFRPKPTNPFDTEIGIVYDSQGVLKSKCPPVFSVDSNGVPTVNNRGKYYKNVRHEWATLVHTPLTAKFQDALAFTRSLGDLHLATYGITHMPEIQRVDLSKIFGSIKEGAPPADIPLLTILVSSDGVWDNWLYEDVSNFVMDNSCVSVATGNINGCSKINKAFMQRNDVFAKQNFGSHADNATSIMLYVSNSRNFPSNQYPSARRSRSNSSINSQGSTPASLKSASPVDTPKHSSRNTAAAAMEALEEGATTTESTPPPSEVSAPAPAALSSSSSLDGTDSLSAAIAEVQSARSTATSSSPPSAAKATNDTAPEGTSSSLAVDTHIFSPRLSAAGALLMSPTKPV